MAAYGWWCLAFLAIYMGVRALFAWGERQQEAEERAEDEREAKASAGKREANHKLDKAASIRWARELFEQPEKHIILDCETTGLRDQDEIIELAIIDMEGRELFNQRILPAKKTRIAPKAREAHGIKYGDLRECPKFSEMDKQLRSIMRGKTVVAYNAAFDRRMFRQSYAAGGGYSGPAKWECAMLQYSSYVGEWNEYHDDYRWQKLVGGDHSALGDCKATLALLGKMARTRLAGESA